MQFCHLSFHIVGYIMRINVRSKFRKYFNANLIPLFDNSFEGKVYFYSCIVVKKDFSLQRWGFAPKAYWRRTEWPSWCGALVQTTFRLWSRRGFCVGQRSADVGLAVLTRWFLFAFRLFRRTWRTLWLTWRLWGRWFPPVRKTRTVWMGWWMTGVSCGGFLRLVESSLICSGS